MPELPMDAFHQELEKLAGPLAQSALKVLKSQALQRGLGGVGAGAGLGGAVGALTGAGIEGVKGYRSAKGQGATTIQALANGLGGSIGGAMKGGIAGAGVGAAGLGSLAAARPGVAKALRSIAKREGAIGSLTRAGQRQVHAVTGWTPQGMLNSAGARELRAGAYDAAEQAAKAEKGLGKAWNRVADRAAAAPTRATMEALPVDADILRKAVKEQKRAKGYLTAAEKAEGMGLTSLPGYFKSMKERGIGKTLWAGGKEQWKSGPMGKAFIAAPIGMAAKELATPGESGEGGRLERAGKALGGLGFAAGPLPFTGQILMHSGATTAGGLAGKVGDVATKGIKRRRAVNRGTPLPQSIEPAGGSAIATEYDYSPRAMGQIPEGVGA